MVQQAFFQTVVKPLKIVMTDFKNSNIAQNALKQNLTLLNHASPR